MAIVGSNLTNDKANTVSVTSQATASITPSSNNLVLAYVSSRTNITTDPNQPTATGNGLTWVAIGSIVWDTTSTSRKRLTLFRAMGASPSTGAITFDFGGQTQTDVTWSVDQFSGVDTTGTNGSGAVVQFATAKDETTPSGLTVTLAAFGSTNNATYAGFTNDGATGTPTAGGGMTALATPVGNNPTITEWQSTNNTTPSATFANVGMVGGVAIEIKAAGGVAANPLNFRLLLGVGV